MSRPRSAWRSRREAAIKAERVGGPALAVRAILRGCGKAQACHIALRVRGYHQPSLGRLALWFIASHRAFFPSAESIRKIAAASALGARLIARERSRPARPR